MLAGRSPHTQAPIGSHTMVLQVDPGRVLGSSVGRFGRRLRLTGGERGGKKQEKKQGQEDLYEQERSSIGSRQTLEWAQGTKQKAYEMIGSVLGGLRWDE